MSEEIDNVELNDEPEYIGPESTDENEEVVVEEPKKEEFKPWKEKKVPETIPYSRFSEIVAEKNAYADRIRENELKLAEYEKINQKVSKVNSIDELDINNFEDIKEYNKAFAEVMRREIQQENEKIAEQKRIQDIETKIMTEFSNRISKASEKNSEIGEAAEYIGQFAQHIPAQTRYALLVDENSPEVMYEIATTPGLLQDLVKMNPIDATRKIARMSAKYDGKEDVVVPKSMPKQVANIPSQMSVKPKAAGTPNVRAEGTGGSRFSENMSMSEYRKLRGNK